VYAKECLRTGGGVGIAGGVAGQRLRASGPCYTNPPKLSTRASKPVAVLLLPELFVSSASYPSRCYNSRSCYCEAHPRPGRCPDSWCHSRSRKSRTGWLGPQRGSKWPPLRYSCICLCPLRFLINRAILVRDLRERLWHHESGHLPGRGCASQ